jgi:hypothetical protein
MLDVVWNRHPERSFFSLSPRKQRDMQTNSFLIVIFRIITSFYDMHRRSARFACMILVALAAMFMSSVASAQTILRVDIVNGLPNGDGQSWSTAFRFLQDALDEAVLLEPELENPVHIWVAQGTYRPDQNKNNDDPNHPDPGKECTPDIHNSCCPPYGDCNRDVPFEIPAFVHLYGGFPEDPHTWNNNEGAEFVDRDPAVYETILSGDLGENVDHGGGGTWKDIITTHSHCDGELVLSFDRRADNSDLVVEMAGQHAVLDGFTVSGRIHISGAGARLLDCTFIVAEGPALRCFGGSNIQLWRCAFAIRADSRAENRTIDELILADETSDVIIINSRILRESTEALPVNMERLPRRAERHGESDSQHPAGRPVTPNWQEEATGR